jgi:hypothetical protein
MNITRVERFRICSSNRFVLLGLFAFSPFAVNAQEGGGQAGDNTNYNRGWSIGVNVEYTDNFLRTPIDETEETTGAAYLRFDFGASRERWRLSAISDLQYRVYQNDVADNELLGGLTAQGELKLFGDYLWLTASDHYGQAQQDVTQPDSPVNRGYINELSVGAHVEIPIGRRLALFGSDNWSTVSYGESTEDYERNAITAGLRQSLSERTSVFLQASRSRVQYSADGTQVIGTANQDYDIEEGVIGFNANLARTTMAISGGQTRVRGMADSPDQLLLRASISRKIGARLTLSLDGGTEYSDTTQTFVREQQSLGPNVNGATREITADPFKSDYGTFGVAYDGSRYDVRSSLLYRKERHEQSPERDGEYAYAELVVTRRFSERASVSVTGGYNQSDRMEVAPNGTIVNSDDTLHDTRVRLSFNVRPWRNVVVEAYGETYSGSSTGFDYRENRAGLSIGYSPYNAQQ